MADDDILLLSSSEKDEEEDVSFVSCFPNPSPPRCFFFFADNCVVIDCGRGVMNARVVVAIINADSSSNILRTLFILLLCILVFYCYSELASKVYWIGCSAAVVVQPYSQQAFFGELELVIYVGLGLVGASNQFLY